ncbi:MAG: N-acetylmuramoyl-L-alanine amidase [Planctomycetota bacterium]|nr:MAG: N-acetylmuramoyl-L-alanine amidase [Planctomycetota bacterium]
MTGDYSPPPSCSSSSSPPAPPRPDPPPPAANSPAAATRSSSPAASSTPARRSSSGSTRAATTPTAPTNASPAPARPPGRPIPAPRTPNRYSSRNTPGDPNSLTDLQRHIDQFVIHYDAAGTSRQCFKILHDLRGLSSHFLLDLDGTIYQTLDLKEKAWHATIANDRSIGIEIANIGAYPLDAFATDAIPAPDPHHITTPQIESSPLAGFYARDKSGYFLTLPGWLGDGGYRTPDYLLTYPRPSRPLPITGTIQGQTLTQFDLTDAQYDSLIRLTATLCTVFPELRCDYPRDAAGRPIDHALTPDQFAHHHGLLGHYHVQQNKLDPGPAFDWERVVVGARRLRASR